MVGYKSFAVIFLLGLTVVAAQRRQPGIRRTPTSNRPSSSICRGEFDCKQPNQECQNGYCTEVFPICRFPGKPYFGDISPESPLYDVGEEIEFRCNPGFKLVGDGKMKCQDNGKWSRLKPRCVASQCNNPGRPYRGIITPDKQSYQIGETVQVGCKSYYIRSGPPAIQCREDGTWSPELAVCNKPSGIQ